MSQRTFLTAVTVLYRKTDRGGSRTPRPTLIFNLTNNNFAIFMIPSLPVLFSLDNNAFLKIGINFM